jgi:hypothetical protein
METSCQLSLISNRGLWSRFSQRMRTILSKNSDLILKKWSIKSHKNT